MLLLFLLLYSPTSPASAKTACRRPSNKLLTRLLEAVSGFFGFKIIFFFLRFIPKDEWLSYFSFFLRLIIVCIVSWWDGVMGELYCKVQDINFFSTGFLDIPKLMQANNIFPFQPLPSPIPFFTSTGLLPWLCVSWACFSVAVSSFRHSDSESSVQRPKEPAHILASPAVVELVFSI